jgi:DNA invertase Pin-like site-specific DNA recombinase
MTVAIYIRLSRENDDSASIDTQRRVARTWLVSNGYDPDDAEEFVDTNVSGSKPLEQRKGMRALMAARPAVVVAWKLDRYARSVSEFLRLIAWGEAHNVRVATTDNTINTASPTGRMVAVVLAALAEWERSMIAGRISDGHATRRTQGRWSSGRAPYGYDVVRREGAAYLAVNEEQAEAIRTAVLKLIGDGTVAATARMVGIGEAQWRRLLKSPTLRGQRSHRGALVLAEDGITPVQFADPILSAAEHKAVRNRMLALATGQDRAPRSAANMCAGMAWCYRCEGPLNGGGSDKGVRLYKCKFGHVTIYAETLDQRVTDEFQRRWGSMAEHIVRLEGGNDMSDQMAEAQEQAERIAAQMASAGPLMLGKLGEMAEELEAAYASLRAAHDPDVREVLIPTGRTLGEAWDASPGERGRLLADVGLRVVLHPKQRAERLDVSWAIGGDDHELAEFLGDMDAVS